MPPANDDRARSPAARLDFDTQAGAPSEAPTMLGTAKTVVDGPRSYVDPAFPAAPIHDGTARYQTRELLGLGGMGEVHLCKDELIGRDVAVKAIRSEYAGHPEHLGRFVREARVQGQLEHPAIVPVYDLSLAPGAPFFTMKRVRGVTLAEVITRLRAQDAETIAAHGARRLLTAFATVCLAIDFAHARGVIHRDIKPANIMLGDFGEVYVLDWGIVKLHGDPTVLHADIEAIRVTSTEGKTQVGTAIGTPGFMAPEQMAGEDVDVRADVYSLGATLFELLAQKPLHRATGEADLVVATMRGSDARVSVRAPERDVAPELDGICVKATALLPSQRYRTARELSDAIERYLDGDRDLALRRSLAAGHAKTAAGAKARALASDGDTRDTAHREALREVGRALALDPTNVDAQRELVELRVLMPRELPRDARAELDATRDRRIHASTKAGALSLLFVLVTIPAGLWMGVRDARPLVAMAVLVTSAAVIGFTAPPGRARWRFYVVAVLTAGGFSMGSRILGPFLALPTVLMANMARTGIDPSRRRRAFVTLANVAAVFIPWFLEVTGVIAPSYGFAGGTMTVLPHSVSLPAAPTYAFLWATFGGTVVGSALALGRVRRALEAAEYSAHLRTWQLRQLVPEGAYVTHSPNAPRDSA